MKAFITFLLMMTMAVSQFSCKKEEKKITSLIVKSVFGKVLLKSAGKEKDLKPGDEIIQGDLITTSKASLADIQFGVKGLIRINENSKVSAAKLVSNVSGDHAGLDMNEGKVFVIVSKLTKKQRVEVKTPTTVASVRGTSFRIVSDSKSSSIAVLSGKIKVNPVKEGKVVESVEKIIETNSQIVMDEKLVEQVIEGKKEIEVETLKPEQVKEIKEEVKDIKVEKSMDAEIKKEIEEVVRVEKKEEKTEEDKKDDEKLKEQERARKASERKARLNNQVKKERAAAARNKAEKERLEKARIEKERLAREQKEKARIDKAKKEQKKKEGRVKNIPNL